ncbi:MAG: nucleotidyltransferase domain-containing protein [Candidatus Omnitrophica bacterium]|nr:nucleotidyltransferase domain-containing protein [Candidatus Omnitrophota bacterium]
MPTQNPRINVVLEKPLYKRLEQLAKKHGISLSKEVRDLVRDGVGICAEGISGEVVEREQAGQDVTPIEEKALDVFKKAVLKEFGKKVLSIRLFGSKARGDADKFSDVDVLVILSEGDWHEGDEVHKITASILVDYQVDISAKVINAKHFAYLKKIKSPFLESIRQESILLHGTDGI